jgi:hypothetical protein
MSDQKQSPFKRMMRKRYSGPQEVTPDVRRTKAVKKANKPSSRTLLDDKSTTVNKTLSFQGEEEEEEVVEREQRVQQQQQRRVEQQQPESYYSKASFVVHKKQVSTNSRPPRNVVGLTFLPTSSPVKKAAQFEFIRKEEKNKPPSSYSLLSPDKKYTKNTTPSPSTSSSLLGNSVRLNCRRGRKIAKIATDQATSFQQDLEG